MKSALSKGYSTSGSCEPRLFTTAVKHGDHAEEQDVESVRGRMPYVTTSHETTDEGWQS